MRVAIVNLTAGGLSGGYAKYLRRIVPRLAAHRLVRALTVFVPERARAELDGADLTIASWTGDDMRRGFPDLKRQIGELRPDVVFIPTASWLDFGGTPVVAMVRNMEPLEAAFGGNPVREAARNLARRTMARRACRRARRVIAVSDHVRRYLVSRWNIPGDKVPVIHHGVDMPAADAPATPPAALRGVDPGFLFTAGSIRPARGLRDVVDALPHLDRAGVLHRLVVAGKADAGMEPHRQSLLARARRIGVDDRIVWTGALSEAEMRWCYRVCSAFVMTSRAEACPNIALEAMSCGCASVAVERPPMPEFFGDAAVYYPAGDAAALARSIARLLESDRRQQLRTAAVARARTFDWETTANRTAEELQAAVHS